MRSKTSTSAVQWNDKNRIYLERLGLIDGRSGRKRRDAGSISKFINECVIEVLESGKHKASAIASPEELLLAFKRHRLGLLSAQKKALEAEINLVAAAEVREKELEVLYQ